MPDPIHREGQGNSLNTMRSGDVQLLAGQWGVWDGHTRPRPTLVHHNTSNAKALTAVGAFRR